MDVAALRRVRERRGTVADVIDRLYRSYGDRAAFDAHLHPEITIWESDRPSGLMALGELDALRDQRATAQASRPELRVADVVVDRWGEDVAVARYLLHARAGQRSMTFRVTDVLSGEGDSWQIVHHHSELFGTSAGGPASGDAGPVAPDPAGTAGTDGSVAPDPAGTDG